MWYFSWILGLGLALAFAILNAMWFELHADDAAKRLADAQPPPRGCGTPEPIAFARGADA